MARDFGGKPWSWFHHMAVVLAAKVNDPPDILFWHEHEPTGQWWRKSRKYLTLRKIKAPAEIHGRPLVHPAHKADVVRLLALLECGGVYIDSDVWCLRPFSELAHAGFWMGRQGPRYGLCNATMGGQAGSAFVRAWLETYATFRSTGRDRFWDEHSVRVPLRLSRHHKDGLTIYPPNYFFAPLWGRLGEIFRPGLRPSQRHLSASYSVHLWESVAWDYLRHLKPGSIHPESEIGRRLEELRVL